MSKNTKGPKISLTKRIDVRLEFLTSNTVISLFIIGLDPYLIKQYDTFANGYNYYHARFSK